MTEPTERELDLILVGATGFVGRLVARHLAAHAPDGLRVALAGRSAERLVAVRAALPGRASDWPAITVDVLDPGAAADLARRAAVVLTTVGPYLRYGLPLVQACAHTGTHYADLTGETLFVRRSIDTAHDPAVTGGARIVHASGFDSIPSDLGVGLTAARAVQDGAGELTSAVLHVQHLRGGISGGTIDSLRQQILETGHDPRARRQITDPYALVDEVAGRPYGGSAPARRWPVGRDPRTRMWQAPFVMGAFNRQIVHRSNALADWSYGRGLQYREVVDTGRGPAGPVAATAVAVGTGALVGGLALRPTRAVLDRLLPAPGEGPDEARRRRGSFRVAVEAETSSGARYRTVVGADLDPGYDGTAVMLGETGLALIASDDLGPAGVVTPMTAVGAVLPQRLRSHGFTVETVRLT